MIETMSANDTVNKIFLSKISKVVLGSRLIKRTIYITPAENDHPINKRYFWSLFLKMNTDKSNIITIM